jgi:DNA-binding CsgD family transcriptional regulator
MAAGKAKRPREEGAVDEFIDRASTSPSALLIEGEPGIGKTTLWSTALVAARARGFQVLSARATAAESVSAYTALAELLADVDPTASAGLPKPQQLAVDQILSDSTVPGAATDQRAVAAAFLSIIDSLKDNGPVLLAIDDLPWLDPSSARVIAYTARRLTGPVGVIATIRTDPELGDAGSWLQLPRPDAVRQITLGPLSARALHTVVSENAGRALPRPTIARIHQVSGGNPFYALELARALDENADKALPTTLAEVVHDRIGALDPEIQVALLAVASLAIPTIDRVVAAAATDRDRLVELLEVAETRGIIAIEGHRVRFTHPLLAAGVYADAPPEQRRAMHRRLADVVGEAELRARHLALAATKGDPETLQALDDAADAAAARGAPAAAAELLDLAIKLGGDHPLRRIQLGLNTFDAGDPGGARAVLEQVIAALQAGPLRAQARHALAVVRFMDDGYLEGCQLLQRALDEDTPEAPVRVAMLTALTYALYMTGDPEAAWHCGEQAVAHAEPLGDPGLLSQALGVRATLQFFGGGGIDSESLQRALDLEDHETFTPTMLRPSVEHALILACTGELDRSCDLMRAVEQRCVEKGEEGELIFVDFYVVVSRIWRGDFAEANRLANDLEELARQLGGEFPAMLSLVLKAWLAVFDGSEDEARPAVAAAIDASKVSGTSWHEDWALTALGFLEVSLGNYRAAVNALGPLMSRHVPHCTEIQAASFFPDAVEALVELGRVGEAEPFVDALEQNGHRLDRTWMLAVGARCRAMVLAAHGDHKQAVVTAQQAMAHHDRLPMPFERARTLLLLGQLQLRQRDPDAQTSLREALAAFEDLGIPLWADRARAQISAADVISSAATTLTATERRVAELAALGLTNRAVADDLLVSAKTVEATLARVYRKLGIRSRAQLGQTMGKPVS